MLRHSCCSSKRTLHQLLTFFKSLLLLSCSKFLYQRKRIWKDFYSSYCFWLCRCLRCFPRLSMLQNRGRSITQKTADIRQEPILLIFPMRWAEDMQPARSASPSPDLYTNLMRIVFTKSLPRTHSTLRKFSALPWQNPETGAREWQRARTVTAGSMAGIEEWIAVSLHCKRRVNHLKE